MCNGPSVKKVNLEALRGQDVAGMNGAYRYYREKNWWPKYFCCFDYRVTENHATAYADLMADSPIENFFLLSRVSGSPKLSVLEIRGALGTLASEFNKFGNGGNTGVNTCQVGMCLGYDKIILIGADCNYVEVVDGAVGLGVGLVMAETPDHNPNYFFDSYQRKGDSYNYPQAATFHLPAWQSLSRFAEKNGIDIVNCSEGSKLECFRKSTIDVELGIPEARLK